MVPAMEFDQKLAQIIDYAVLKPDTTNEHIDQACQEARKYRFAAVCVNPSYVPLAAKLLHGSGVKVSAVIGFPLGASTSTVKSIEARNALLNGADEIDMVLNIGALKSNETEIVNEEIKMVRNVTNGHVLKIILETCLLNKEEKIKACEIASSQGVNFIKTSTGFSTGGATVEDIKLIRQVVGIEMG
ncbi:MAG: deoxyribose-phosphate aldolase, partial [bacterium]|nr:deoxyribose-phosphate aldolase [bacterium]